jgi:hypothetical protein
MEEYAISWIPSRREESKKIHLGVCNLQLYKNLFEQLGNQIL